MAEHVAPTQLGIPTSSWDLMPTGCINKGTLWSAASRGFQALRTDDTLAPSTAGGPAGGQGSKGSQTVLTILSVYIRTAIATSARYQ